MLDLQEQEDFDQEEDTQKNQFLTFWVGEEAYGIEIRHVTEIISILKITPVPQMPSYIMGIINLRGRIIPVMDMRLKFKMEQIPYNERSCIIVVDMDKISIGLIVDSVAEVLSIAEDDIVPPPEFSKTGNRYMQGIGKVSDGVRLILDCDRLLSEEDKDEALDLTLESEVCV